ncbi:MAG: ligase-associated DNA damage response endonuclease PdeM [Verrucomicrobiota bacterium]
MNLEMECSSERLILLPEKAIFWPRTSSLLVADLHFGKPAAFRQSGIAVPEATTAFDLKRLDKILRETESKRLIILGDFFHAAAGRQPEMMETLDAWCQKNSGLETILVPGNHDRKSGEPPACWKIQIVPDGWGFPPFSFCHEPKSREDSYVFCGHLHPAISIREKFGSGIRAPCFWFGPQRAVLPAFGSFTGMHSIQPRPGERIFAVGDDEIIEVTWGYSRVRQRFQR